MTAALGFVAILVGCMIAAVALARLGDSCALGHHWQAYSLTPDEARKLYDTVRTLRLKPRSRLLFIDQYGHIRKCSRCGATERPFFLKEGA